MGELRGTSPSGVVVSMKPRYAGDLGLIPRRVETLCSLSVNHSLTIPRCKIRTNPMNEDDHEVIVYLIEYSHQGWVSSQVGYRLGS